MVPNSRVIQRTKPVLMLGVCSTCQPRQLPLRELVQGQRVAAVDLHLARDHEPSVVIGSVAADVLQQSVTFFRCGNDKAGGMHLQPTLALARRIGCKGMQLFQRGRPPL